MNIPYCFFPWKIVRRGSAVFFGLSGFLSRSSPEIELELKKANMGIKAREYISAALFSDLILLIFLYIFSVFVLLNTGVSKPFLFAGALSFLIIIFILFQQMSYPRAVLNKRIKSIDKHLIPALSTMQIQLNSGIPLYNVILSISRENYGGISEQFKKAVKEINSGMSQLNVFENMAAENPSIYFQRILWQIVTAMKSGSDLGRVISRIISSLSEEQLVSVQAYGSRLNPLTMFYMLIVVIVPALALTFIVVLSSFMSLQESALKSILWGMYSCVFLFQLLFMTMIASKRPSLL